MKRITLTICTAAFLLFACNNEKTADVASSTTSKDSTDAAKTESTSPPMDSAAMMQAWQNFMTPGEMHKLLASFNGTWKGEVTMWMDPAAPPITSTATATNRMIYNGLYQESKHSGNMMGMPFEGTSIWGYDNAKKKFVSTWIDNMGSGIMVVEGDYDPSTKTFSFAGTTTNPLDGKECNIRETVQVIDGNTQVMKMYGPDRVTGKEFQTMEIKMTRSK